MTEADLIQAQFDIGVTVTFPAKGGARAVGTITKLNQRTATVRQGPEAWRVPYALLELRKGQRCNDRAQRLLEVAGQARELMDRHGLKDWTFRFSAARRTIGLCREKEKVIQLGRHHAANDPPEQVTDTILHEIAHGLAGTAAGHGPAWRKAALSIGATPRASKAVDPARAEATRNSLSPGTTIGFRSGSSVLTGVVVKLNRKTARVSCTGRLLLVPYDCVVEAPTNSGSTTWPRLEQRPKRCSEAREG